MKFIQALTFLVLGFTLICGAEPDIMNRVKAVAKNHGIGHFWEKEIISMDYKRVKNGEILQQAQFVFEAHGDKSMMILPDGNKVIYDGKEAWGSASPAEIKGGRFHVWTWPWFLIAPFKMSGRGISLGDPKTIDMDGKDFPTLKQTFANDQGDAPDDWYRLFFDEDAKRLAAMIYIVSYAKDKSALKEAKQSIIVYSRYQTVEGVLFPVQGDFWTWDADSGKKIEPEPRYSIYFKNIRFLQKDSVDFAVPQDYHHFPKN